MKFEFTPGRRNDRIPVSRDDPVGTDSAGRTALHYAVIDDPVGLNYTAGLKDPAIAVENFGIGNAFRIENTIRLLACGADPNAADNVGFTPLHAASQGDSVDVVKILISAQADVNAVAEEKQTPLYNALLNTTTARRAIAEAAAGGRCRPAGRPGRSNSHLQAHRYLRRRADEESSRRIRPLGPYAWHGIGPTSIKQTEYVDGRSLASVCGVESLRHRR